MKNIKKILFSFIFVCISFCFVSNVFADTTCRYEIDNPFNDDFNVISTNYPYMKYIYKKKLGLSDDDFINYIEKIRFYPYGFKDFTTITKLNLTLHLNKNLDLQYVYSTGEVKAIKSVSFDISDKNSDICPDIIAISIPDRVIHWKNSNNYYTYSSIANYYYLQNNDVDNLIVSIFNDKIWNDEAPLIFMNPDLKVATGGIMYVNKTYNRYFNSVYDEDNIDPIVEKYLKIDGVKNALNQLNTDLDNSFENGKISSYSLDKKTMSTIVENITDFDIIDSELNVLKNFNSKGITNYTGLHNTLNAFLSESAVGYKASEWFSKYMPDSKAQYADSLEILLSILNSEETKNEVNSKNELEDLARNYGYCRINFNFDEEKIKENCMESCKNYQEFKKEYDCRNSGNPSACVASYPSNFCTGKTSEEIANDMNEKIEEIDNNIEETLEKKIIEYYENKGIEIGNTDFCDILVGKDNEKGLYPYIKMVLNVIRIGGPILVVILTALDAMKVISSFKDDENKKFWNHLKIRLICLVVLILVPTIINFLVKLVIESSCSVEI